MFVCPLVCLCVVLDVAVCSSMPLGVHAVAKTRIAEAAKRLEKVGTDIDKAYWTDGREELRRYAGTLRFDINTLAASSSPEVRMQIMGAKKKLFANIEAMDMAMKNKDQQSAAQLHDEVVAEIGTLSSFL